MVQDSNTIDYCGQYEYAVVARIPHQLSHTLRSSASIDRRKERNVSAFDARKFARHLRAAREEAGLTQPELAKRSSPSHLRGVSTPYISLLERAIQDGRPGDAILESLAWGLQRDIAEIRSWAGILPAPDWSTTLKAIEQDRNLSESDKELISDIYLRLVPPRA